MTPTNGRLRLAIQKSGRLSEQTLEFLQKSGLRFEMVNRALVAPCENFPLELLFLRSKDIPEMVADGTAHLGICGQDSLQEEGETGLTTLRELGFGRCRLSLAAPPEVKDIAGLRIATSFPRILGQYLAQQGIRATMVELSGSVEIAPGLGTADAICDLVSTGSTLRTNGLQELSTIMQSQAVLIARDALAPEKQTLLEPHNGESLAGGERGSEKNLPLAQYPAAYGSVVQKLLMRLDAYLQAKNNKYIVMNAPKDSLPRIQSLIPGLNSPTVTPLADPDFISVACVVAEDTFWDTIEKLKMCGAQGILVLPIEKMIL